VNQLILDLFPAGIFAFLLSFARIGAMFMSMPVFGETYVSSNIRLTLALATTFAGLAFTMPLLPPSPSSPAKLALMLIGEIGVGVYIGLTARMFTTALSTAGTIIGMQSGLSFAQFFDPAQGSQSALVSAFMSIFGMLFIFATDLHLMVLRAVFDSFVLFPPTRFVPLGEFALLAARAVDDTWALGIQLSAPFIVYGVIFSVGTGVLNRLMPQVQVTYMTQPAQILGSFAVLAATLSTIYLWFADHLERHLATFLVK
jgi:flagellar biosynthetic protein FliR